MSFLAARASGPSSNLPALTRQLHAEAVRLSDAPGLPTALRAALAAWLPDASGAPLRVGVLGLPGSGKTSLCEAIAAQREPLGPRRVGLPPGVSLLEGPPLTHGGPSFALLDWVSSLDAVLLLHPLRVGLSASERSLLSALAAWGIPVQLGVCQADLEIPETEGGQVRRSATVRLACNMAELAEQAQGLGLFPLPVTVSSHAGIPGLAGATGAFWMWSEERDRLAAARDLRQLARLLEAVAAAGLSVPPPVQGSASAAPVLCDHAQAPLRQLAAQAWQALAGGTAGHDLASDDPAAALVPLLAAFAEAGFLDAFLAVLEGASQAPGVLTVVLAGGRPAAFRLMGLLYHALARQSAWQALPAAHWIVSGVPPTALPEGTWTQLAAPKGLAARLNLVVPPQDAGPEAWALCSRFADAVVIAHDPRDPGRPAMLAGEEFAAGRARIVYAFGDAATLAPDALTALARRSDHPPWFLHDGYDARYTQWWQQARESDGSHGAQVIAQEIV